MVQALGFKKIIIMVKSINKQNHSQECLRFLIFIYCVYDTLQLYFLYNVNKDDTFGTD